MSDSSDEVGEERGPWVLYKHRENWKDVTPVPQDDGPNPVVAISYSEQFEDAHDYFRAILKSGELSERALQLTTDCLWLNTANYTVWQYRREILNYLKKDLHEELEFLDTLMKRNSKNYQIWHHRKSVVELLQNPSRELEVTAEILKKDAKNYHTWQHRQWVIKTFQLFDKELDYVEELIEDDIRNNSAWNQRYFVLKHTTQFEPEVIDREVDYALRKISIVKGNESAWNYLRGVLMNDKRGGLGKNEMVAKKCEELFNDNCRINHLLGCIIDIAQERHPNESVDSIFHIDHAIKLCTELADEYDKIRKNYWNYMKIQLEELKA